MTQYQAASAVHVPQTQSAFASTQHAYETALRAAALDAQMQTAFGVRASQSITFNSWSPDPWQVVGTNGALLCSVSRISMTIIRPDPPQKVFYILTFHIKSEGWTSTPPNSPPYASLLRIDIKNAQGGIIWSFDQRIGITCGIDNEVRLSETFYVDVFNQIAGAGLSMPNVTFWHC